MSSYDQDPYRPVGYQPLTSTPDSGDRARAAANSLTGPAADVKDTAVTAGKDVLEAAKHEAGEVVGEAKLQGRRLLDESMGELRGQAETVQARLADTVRALTDELGSMASAPDADGPLAQLAGSGRDFGDRAAAWLRDNDLDQALHGVRRYAARNPWTFLAIAGGAGLLVGRLARGLRDADAPDELGTNRRQGLGTQETYAYDRVSETGTYPTDPLPTYHGDVPEGSPTLEVDPLPGEGDVYRGTDTRGQA